MSANVGGGGINAQVINTEILDIFSDSLGKGILSFPDLTTGILGPLNSSMLSISLVLGLFVFGFFILSKTKPDLLSQLSKLPGGGGLSHIKGKNWGTFLLQFAIISVVVYSFLGFSQGGEDSRDNIKTFFTGKYEVGSNDENNSLIGSSKNGMVTVTIKPLEGIRITGVKFDSEGNKDKNTINNSTSKSVIDPENNPKCNYERISKPGNIEGIKSQYQDCVYPQAKQGMLVVDSFSIQGNVEKHNPVNIYITNDYDGVYLKNYQGKGRLGDYNSNNSITKQNETHSIISVLRNNETVFKEAGKDSSFINYLDRSINTLTNTSLESLKVSDLGNVVGPSESMRSGLMRVYENLFEVRRRLIKGEEKSDIVSLLNNINSTELTFIGIKGTNSILESTYKGDADSIKNMVNKFGEGTNYQKGGGSYGLSSYTTYDSFVFNEDSANSYDNGGNQFNSSLSRMYSNYKKAVNGVVTIDDIIKSITEGKSYKEILKEVDTLIGIGEKPGNQFLTTIDQFYGALTTSGTKLASNVGDGADEGIMIDYYNMGSGITSLIISLQEYSEFKTIRNHDGYPYRPVLALSIISDSELSKGFMNSLRDIAESGKNLIEKNIDIFNESSNKRSSLNSLNEIGVIAKFTGLGINKEFTSDINYNRKFLIESLKRIYVSILEKDNQELLKNKNNPELVYFNKGFISQFLHSGYYKAEQVLDYDSGFEDIVNSVGKDGITMKYRGPHNQKIDDDLKYGIWNNEKRIEEANKSIFSKALGGILSSIGLGGEKDVTYVGVEGGQGLEIRKGDIIFGSPGTTIYALPYPIELMMSKDLADTIEFIDDKGGSLGFYSDRYNDSKELISRGIGKEKEVGKITGGLYGMIMYGLDSSGKSVNWLFNSITGYGVIESGFGATILLIFTLLAVSFAYLFYFFKNVALYGLTFAFFIIFIWLFLLDGQPKRVAKKVLAWFVSLSLIPLWGYLIMFIFYKSFGDDQSFLYNLRNFSSFSSFLIAIVIAYVPIMIFFGTRKFLLSLIVDGKLDKSLLTVGSFFGAGTGLPVVDKLGKGIDEKINRGMKKGKDLANKGKEKISDSIGSKKKSESISTVGSLGDGKNDIANNELINRIVGKEKANEFDVNRVEEFDFNNYKRNEFDSHKKATNNLNQRGLRRNNRIEGLKKSRDEAQLRLEKLNNERRNQELKLMNNNTSTKEEKISGVTPELINSVNSIRKGMKSQGSTDRDFMRLLLAMFDQNKELLTNLTKALQEAQDKSSDPVIQGKLNNSNHTLTSKDLEIIKAIKEEKGIRGDITKEQLKKELNDTILKMKDGDFNHEYLDKIKAINSFNSVIHNDNQEEKFYAMTESISGILAEMKNQPGFGVEKEITKYIMNGDQQGLNLYKEQNSHIEGLDVLVNKIQMMPHEMMRVLSSNASAAEMRNNAQGINEFIGLMKNSQQLEQLKHQDMNKYLSTMMQIQDFKNSTFEEKMNMASIASVQSIQSIKEANRVTTALSNEMSKIMQSQGSISQKSITNIVQNIAGTTEISVRDQRDLTNKLKENLNKIREVNK